MFFLRRSPMRIRFHSVRFDFFAFIHSLSFSAYKLSKSTPHISEPIHKPLREVPISRIRFYRGINRVLPTVHTRTKNNHDLPRVREMAYFWPTTFWFRQVDKRVFVLSTSRERSSQFGKRTAGSVALRKTSTIGLRIPKSNLKKKDRIEIGLSCHQDTRLLPPSTHALHPQCHPKSLQARDIMAVADGMSLEQQQRVSLKDVSLRLQLGMRREILQSVVGYIHCRGPSPPRIVHNDAVQVEVLVSFCSKGLQYYTVFCGTGDICTGSKQYAELILSASRGEKVKKNGV